MTDTKLWWISSKVGEVKGSGKYNSNGMASKWLLKRNLFMPLLIKGRASTLQ